jgi:hypothetical protein
MLVYDKKHFTMGIILSLIFFGVLAYMFTPSFTGAHGEKVNAFHASDNLFNSIAKGSTNYFHRLREENKTYAGHAINLNLEMGTADLAGKSALILNKSGIAATVDTTVVKISGDLATLLNQAIDDSESMFNNKNDLLEDKYSMSGRMAIFVWWKTCVAMDIALKQAKDFKAAKFTTEVVKRGIEVGYNFYGVVPQSSTSRAGVLTFALVFYVVYTLLWGFAIFYFFEGFGLQMSSGKKKEM